MPAHVVAAKAGLTSAADIHKAYEANDTATLKKVADFWNTGFKTDKGVDPDCRPVGWSVTRSPSTCRTRA